MLFNSLRQLLGLEIKHSLCMIVCEQEGAEIWIDGIFTNQVTPKLVAIPFKKDVKVMIKMIGHEDHHAVVKANDKLSFYYCELKRIPLRLIKNEDYFQKNCF